MDMVGLGFRHELMAGIAAHADRIDVLEVLADDALTATREGLQALRTLGAQVPLVVHGTSLGLASTEPADERRLAKVAGVVEKLQPRFWSEHLAFVRGGGVEIGHLAAPARNQATIDGAARNLARAARAAGALPLVENVATLVDPPGSELREP